MKEKLCQGQLTRDPQDKDPFRKKQQLAVASGLFKEKNVEQKIHKAHVEAVAFQEALEAFIDEKAREKDGRN
jgi:hypothetical protein